MWQGIQVISDYKPSNSTPTGTEELNAFNEINYIYARFDSDSKETATMITLSADHEPHKLTSRLHWAGLTHARLLAPTAFLDVCLEHVQSSLQGSSQTFSTCPSPKQLCQHDLSPHPLCQFRNTPPPDMPEWLLLRSTHTYCYKVLWATSPNTPQELPLTPTGPTPTPIYLL